MYWNRSWRIDADADNARFNYLDGDSDLIADSDGIADGSGEYQHGPSLA